MRAQLNSLPTQGRFKCLAFTLIELLAVILIVSILAALGFQGFKIGAAKAQEAKFISNLRQTSAALLMLAGENDGTILPALDKTAGSTSMWQLRLAPYLGEDFTTAAKFDDPALVLRSVMRDPADRTLTPLMTPNRPTRNIAINGNANMVDAPTTGVTNRKLGSIKWPSKLAMLGPGASASISTEWGSGGKLLAWEMKNQPLGDYSRYGEYMHFAFADGHIEKVSWTKVEEELQLSTSGRSVLFDTKANNGGN